MTFLEYLALLQRRWRAWASMVVIGLLAACAVNLLADEQYVAVARSFVAVADEDAAGAGESFQGSQFVTHRMTSYATLSSSPAVLDGVIDELGLGLSPRDLKQIVDVSSPTDSVILEVSVEHSDPELAAVIADEVSHQLADLIEELETPRGRAASSVEVVLTHPAATPLDPASPRVTLNLLLGLVGGVAAGVVLALLREHFDRRVMVDDDIRAITGSKPLGPVNAVRKSERTTPLVVLNHRSAEAEQYRAVRSALKVSYGSSAIRHVVVTCPAERDGSTSEAANLAVSWALSGARVCVVDAGLRRPAISRLFGVESTVGLSDVLSGEVDLQTALVPWNDGMLTVLPAGFLPVDPAETLGSDAMAFLAKELQSRFDIVIYDAEPMLEVADAVLLARFVDGLLLVARAGTTRKEDLESCLGLVHEARVRLLGTIRAGVRARWRGDHRGAPTNREPHRARRRAQQSAELSPSA